MTTKEIHKRLLKAVNIAVIGSVSESKDIVRTLEVLDSILNITNKQLQEREDSLIKQIKSLKRKLEEKKL